MRTMVDSVTAANLPAGMNLYAAYINGRDTANNYAEVRARFPDAHILTITTDGDPAAVADICDCEQGDYNPASAAAWAHGRLAVGVRPTIYASRDTWPLVVAQLGEDRLTTDWWATTLDGTEVVAGAVAVQYVDHGPYDSSMVWDDNWHPTAAPPIPPLPQEVTSMVIGNDNGKLVVAGVAKDNGDLLVFTLEPTGWSVIDVTEALHTNPADPRFYRID